MKTFDSFFQEAASKIRVLRTTHYTSHDNKAKTMSGGFQNSPSTGTYHPDDMKSTVYTTPSSRVGQDYGRARVNLRIVNPKITNTTSHADYRKKIKDLVMNTSGDDLQQKAREHSPIHQARNAIRKGDSIVRVADAHHAGPEPGKGSYIMIANKSIVSKTHPTIKKSRLTRESLEESSTSEKGRRLIASRGPSKYDMTRLDQRRLNSDKSALRKAGFRRSSSNQDLNHHADNSNYHSTFVTTHPNQSDYALSSVKSKNLGTGFRRRGKPNSTKSRVKELRTLRKQLGSDRVSRNVHNVVINTSTTHDKNDSEDLFKRHRSFRQSLYDLPKTLRNAGAKPGDKVTGQPAEVMQGAKNRKSGEQKRDKLYNQIFKRKMNSKSGITVGTYRESTELDEKYYQPSDKLSSGKSPLQKALEKREKRQQNFNPKSNLARSQKHSQLTDTKVMRGADHKHYDDTPHSDVNIDSYKDQYLNVHHPESGIEYHVSKQHQAKGTPDVHYVEWTHGRDKTKMSRSERVKMGKAAHDVWKNHVIHRIPHGSILHNRPTRSDAKVKRNQRADIYKKAGFGDVDSEGDQFASLNRPVSPKQRSKGKKQLSPLNSHEVKKHMEIFDSFIAEALHGPKNSKEYKIQRMKNLSKILKGRLGIKSTVKTTGAKDYSHSTHDPDDVSTEIISYKSPAHYAMANSPKTKFVTTNGGHRKVVSNSEREFRSRRILRDITSHKNSKVPTHSIDLRPNLDRDYNDFENIKQRTKNLKRAATKAPEVLRKAGAKTSDIVVIRPGQTQEGGPKNKGQKSRSRLYGKMYSQMSKLKPSGIMTVN